MRQQNAELVRFLPLARVQQAMMGMFNGKAMQVISAVVAAAGLLMPLAFGQVQEAPPAAEQSEAVTEETAEEEAGAEVGEAGTVEDSEDAEDTGEIDDSDLDDSDLDDQSYETDDDVFVPSEEIPADEPIPFPSDI